MAKVRLSLTLFAAAIFAAAILTAAPFGLAAAPLDFKCDPVTDEGWSVVPSNELISEVDGAPYQAGTSGDWFVDRTTTTMPLCNYFNAIGIYSLRSYSLSPRKAVERVNICRAAPGGSVAVPPYAGACPPK